MSETKVFVKEGRRYRPIGINTDLRSFLSNGAYLVQVSGGSLSARRLPDAHLGFAEVDLARLADAAASEVCRRMHSGVPYSPSELGAVAAEAVRSELRGVEVEA